MKDKKLKEITTKKQRKAIKFIKTTCDVKFKGKTPEDVREFIGEWLPRARQIQELNMLVGSTGVEVARAYIVPNNMRATVPDDYDGRSDSLAHTRFETDIIRGRNSVEALMDLQEGLMLEQMLRESGMPQMHPHGVPTFGLIDEDYDDDFDYDY